MNSVQLEHQNSDSTPIHRREGGTAITHSSEEEKRMPQSPVMDTMTVPITNETAKNDKEDNAAADTGPADAAAWSMDTSDFPGPKALFWIMIALLISMFIQNLDSTIIATAIPSITDDFHSVGDVGWYGSACFLTFASFQSTWGKAFKYFPIKPTFLVSLFIFELGSLIIALAPTSTALIVGRAIAGAGAAGVSSGVFTIIAFSAQPAKVPAYMGITGATYAIAAFVGPLLGGVFAEQVTWRWCFWINLPIGATAAAIILFTYKAPKAATPQPATWKETLLQMDLAGTGLIMAAVVCYILALQWGGSTKSWSDSTVIGTLIGFGLLLIAFIANEIYMDERALLMPRIFTMRRVWTTNAYVFFISGGFFALIYYLPIYFQSVQGVNPLMSGIHNLPIIIGCLLCVISGFIVSVTGTWAPYMSVGAALGTIGCGLCYTLDIGTPTGHWIGYQALAGIGIGLGMQIPIMACQAVVSPMDISTVSAITLFFQIIGGSFAVSAAQAAFANTLLRRLPFTAPDVQPAMVLAVGATELRDHFPAEQINGILEAYVSAIKVVFALATALVGVSFVFSLMPKWEKLRVEVRKESMESA